MGIFIGLVLGVAAVAAVIWYLNRLQLPFAEKEQVARVNTRGAPMNLPGKPGDAVSNTANTAKTTAGTPAAGTNAAATPTAGTNAVGASSAPLPEVTPAAPGKQHYLQAGSFVNPDEADNLRAILAMQGIEASVRQVILQDKTFYRLILGPYEKIADARQSRAELARLGVETLLLNQE